MLRKSLLLLPLALFACAAPPETPAEIRPWPETATCPAPADAGAKARDLTARLNAAREGLAPLALDPALSAVAQRYACETAARGEAGPKGSDRSTLSERLARAGVTTGMRAEIYAQASDAEAALAGWMAGGARRSLMGKDLGRLGVGLAGGWWIVTLAAP